jgi:apolipoprotein N-acyltransferase
MKLRYWLAALFLVPLGLSFVPGLPAHGYGQVWYGLPLLLLWLRPKQRVRIGLFTAGWALQVLAYPEPDLGFLGWVLLLPYLIARGRDDGASWWRAAYLFGFLRAHVGYYWLGDVHYTAWIGDSIGSALVFTVTFELVLRRLTLFPFALRAATGWVLYEWVHSWFLGGFPWLFLSHSQYRYLPVIQVADVVGAFGLSFLMAYVQTAFLRRSRAELATAAALLGLTLLYGFLRTGPAPERTPTVLMVQTAVPSTVKEVSARRGNTRARLVELTSEGLDRHPDTALVVWPETMFPGRLVLGDPGASYNWRQALAFARSIRRPCIFGLNVYDSRARLNRGYNSAVLVDAAGERKAIYRKQRLVPMGEEFLARRVFPDDWCDAWFKWLVENVGMNSSADLEAGDGFVALDAGPGLRCAVLICFEGLYPDLAREAVNDCDPDLILHLVNNGWFGETWEQRQCVASWVFRAVETRTPFFSCANAGITCAVNPDGSEAGRLDKVFQEGYLAVATARRWPAPIFLRGGAWILPGTLVLAVAVFWALRRRRSPE